MPPTLRFGVIGLGRAGSGMVGSLAKHPDIKVTAAADRYQEHRDQFERDFGGATFSDGEDLCRSDLVDAVYIATPHEFHMAHVTMAAQYGKHIIVEKPMALTLEDCDKMIATIDKTGVKFIVGHTASYNPSIKKMRQLILNGSVGRLGMISATAYTDFLYRPRRPEELVTELGGGIMYNQIPHQVDATRYVAGGMAKSVRASTFIMDPRRPTEGSYIGFIEFENGAAASLVYSGYDHFDSGELAGGRVKTPEQFGAIRRGLSETVHNQDEETAFRVSTGYGGARSVRERGGGDGGNLLQGELGSFVVSCENADMRLSPKGIGVYSTDGYRLVEPDPWRGVPGRGNVIDELYYAVTEDRPIVHHGRWAKATMEVILAMLQSSKEHREISLQYQVPLNAE